MCGIFGVHGHPDAARLNQLGLYALQHRGQESAGIAAVSDAGEAHAVKRMGLVGEGLTPAELERLAGPVAIGHTRYSTAGSSTLENAQPVLARSRGGHIALAHNGNLINAGELRVALEDEGAIFQSTMDSEVVVHRIARSTAATPEARVTEALAGVEGAYCLLVMIGDTLIAARDPRGWRPFALGRLGEAWVFASETCALDIVGAEFVREIAPGEVLAVDGGGMRSLFPLGRRELRRCVFEHVYFARPDSHIFGGSSTAPAGRSAGASRSSAPRPTRSSSSACPTRPTRPRSATRRRPGCRSSSRSSATTTSAAPSSSPPRPTATGR
jgi:amidophosphoribosyltransferase